MQTVDFELTGEYIELNQLLKVVGLCDSGGAGKQIVASGDVKVDGKQELRKTAKIRAGQKVRLGDVQIDVHAGGRRGLIDPRGGLAPWMVPARSKCSPRNN